MKRFIAIAFFLLMVVCGKSASKDTLKIILPDSSTFRGRKYFADGDSTTYYIGSMHNRSFDKFDGLFEYKDSALHPLYIRMTNGASDTIFLNLLHNSIYQREKYSANDYLLDKVFIGPPKELEFLKSKYYSNKNKCWTIFTKSTNGGFQWGSRYDLEKEPLLDISENIGEDNVMWSVCFIILVSVFLFVVFLPFSKIWEDNKYISGIAFVLFLIMAIGSVFVIDKFLQFQLLLPLLSFLLVPLALKYVNLQGVKRIALLYASLLIIIIAFWVCFQFAIVRETAKLSDGTEVELRWRMGTDLVKRYIIKRAIAKMVPVPVQDHGKKYLVYVSKYEFTEGEKAVLNDEIMSWLTYLLYNDPLVDFSYRESQLMLQRIKHLCGVNFDFLSYNEWKSASLSVNHSPHMDEYNSVDEGEENPYGLVHINGNVPEYTSNYNWTMRLGLAADTIFKAYNIVFVAGSAYHTKDSVSYSMVNKNIREGRVGFRLIYRPYDIGSRLFCIKGTRRNDLKMANLPKEIELLSIDGTRIQDMENYESFEELVVENQYKTHMIEAVDLSNHKRVCFVQPMGIGYYDYEPIFSFVGMDN